MTSQEHLGGDVTMPQTQPEPPVPAENSTPAEPTDIKSAAPPPEKPRIGKFIIYVIVAIILIAACNAFSKEGGDQNGESVEQKGFFQTLFGGGEEQDETPAMEESEQDQFLLLPDGKG